MNNNTQICENCNNEIRQEIVVNGRIKTIELLSEFKIKIINDFLKMDNTMYCSHCGNKILDKAKHKIEEEIKSLKSFISNNLDAIPIITVNNPVGWNYEIIGIVTGQLTIGTGALTEFTSSFTDFFGLESKAHNEKLKKGEEQCFLQLRMQTLELGGNAVISSEIDYSEIGSLKGILMVCSSGTSINIENIEEIKYNKSKLLREVVVANLRLKELESI